MNNISDNPKFQYILESSYASYIKNYMSEKYPTQLLRANVENSIDSLIIELGKKAIEEHDSHYHLQDNSTEKKANTNHLMAREHANKLIIELLNQKFDN